MSRQPDGQEKKMSKRKRRKLEERERREELRQLRKQEKRYQKEEKQIRHQENREIYLIGGLMGFLLLLMGIYFLNFEVSGKEEILVNPLNNRVKNMTQTVRKGDIVTSDGVVVATTQNKEDGTEYRYYPFTGMFAHTVGYSNYGYTGLESTQKIRMLTTHISFFDQLKNELLGNKSMGDRSVMTLNYGLQELCYNLLGGRNGAIIAMEPDTGKLLAMVSEPDYDPNTIAEDWAYLISDENTSGNLVNRASQGLYPPGSTFKILTLLEFIREYPDTWQDFSYDCSGVYTDGEYTIQCHEGHAHGTVDLKGALAQSCNGAFVTIGQMLDPEKLEKLCEDFGYNQTYALDVTYKASSFSLGEDAGVWDLMQAAIGQGTTVTTPLLNLMITCAVAEGGTMMKPYLLDRIESADGEVVRSYEPEVLTDQLLTEEETEILRECMISVIKDGSGYRAGIESYQVAGKTGSAQYNSAGDYHAWFVGYAPAENPQIAVCIILEGGGSGGENAAPLASTIFDYYLQ